MSRCVPALIVCLGAACLVASCEDTSPPVPCVNAPPEGCPEDYGADVCEDPSCRAVYSCKDGQWVFARACGGRDGGTEASTVADSGVATHDARATNDGSAQADAPAGAFGGPGCTPLQPPDCPLGVALECTSASDCCGCHDLFVCEDAGWTGWGMCADGAAGEVRER